jgi:hypothetical protein
MTVNSPLDIYRSFLGTISIKMFRYYENRIPQDVNVLVVSNHRNFIKLTGMWETQLFKAERETARVVLTTAKIKLVFKWI